MKIPKFKIKKIGKFFKKLPRTLGERSFLTFLILLIIALIIGSLVFYKFSFLVKRQEIEVSRIPIKFQEKTYETVLKIWQEKEERFEEANLKEYPNPFR
jgi:O-antigen/teichoic acid export membrane protein